MEKQSELEKGKTWQSRIETENKVTGVCFNWVIFVFKIFSSAVCHKNAAWIFLITSFVYQIFYFTFYNGINLCWRSFLNFYLLMFPFTICYYRRSVLKSPVLIYSLFSSRELICVLKMFEMQRSKKTFSWLTI